MNLKTSEKVVNNTCILIGAGEFNVDPQRVDKDAYIIAVDGGIDYCRLYSINPDLYLGDYDSLSEAGRTFLFHIRENYPEKVISLPKEKDDTDMLAAIKEGMNRGMLTFQIFGGLGKRLEHTIANIQCLIYLKSKGARGELIDKGIRISVIRNESICFERKKKGYLSCFCMGAEASGVSIHGMKYKLNDVILTDSYPIGISNEFIGEESEIEAKEGLLLIIESEFDYI